MCILEELEKYPTPIKGPRLVKVMPLTKSNQCNHERTNDNYIAVNDTLTITVHRTYVDVEDHVSGDTLTLAPDELKGLIEGLAWAAGKVAVEAAREARPEWKDRWEL
jgi:hypothetical protein